MIYRVHQVENDLRITLSLEAGAALDLRDGSGVELTPVDLDAMPEGSRYVTLEEGWAAWEELEPEHREAFRELAKGPGAGGVN